MQTDDIYEDMDGDASGRYNFSEYPIDHPLYSASNCKALGFFKEELNSIPMEEFVELRPKCYAFLCMGKVDRNVLQHVESVEKKTAKGVKRKVKVDHLRFGHYLDVLHSFESNVCKQNLISTSAHTVRTVHSRKVGLTAFYTKRWLFDDTIHIHSYGHRYTVENPLGLENASFITKCIAQTGIYGLHGPPPAAKSDQDSDGDSDWSGRSD